MGRHYSSVYPPNVIGSFRKPVGDVRVQAPYFPDVQAPGLPTTAPMVGFSVPPSPIVFSSQDVFRQPLPVPPIGEAEVITEPERDLYPGMVPMKGVRWRPRYGRDAEWLPGR